MVDIATYTVSTRTSVNAECDTGWKMKNAWERQLSAIN